MGYPIAYGTTSPTTGSLTTNNVSIFISSSISQSLQGKTWGNAPTLPSGGLLIVGYSGSTPTSWTVNDATNTSSVIDTISALPHRVGQAKFTDTSSAYQNLITSGQYFPVLGSHPLNQIVTNGLVFNLDAEAVSSYPTTGSIWYNNSGNNFMSCSLPGVVYSSESVYTSGVGVAYGSGSYRMGLQNEMTWVTVGLFSGSALAASGFDPFLLGFDTSNGAQVNFYRNNGWPTNHLAFLIYTDANVGYRNEWTEYPMNRWFFSAMSAASGSGTGSVLALKGPDQYYSSTLTLGANNFTRWRVNEGEIRLNGGGIGAGPIKFKNIRLYNRGLSKDELLQIYFQGPTVTNGLIRMFDAGNPISYSPEYGTNAYSLTGSVSAGAITTSGSLTNGVGFNSRNGGTFVLDGVDDHINCGSISLTSGFTYEVWTKPSSLSNNYGLLGQGTGITNQGLHIVYVPNSRGMVFGMYYNDADYGSNYVPTAGSWYHWVFTYNGTSYAKQFYANGILQTPTTITQNVYNGTGPVIIGATYSAALDPANGDFAIAKLYNRVLTQAEIAQNYNAYRNRFNI